jgi:hypothetical protein
VPVAPLGALLDPLLILASVSKNCVAAPAPDVPVAPGVVPLGVLPMGALAFGFKHP